VFHWKLLCLGACLFCTSHLARAADLDPSLDPYFTPNPNPTAVMTPTSQRIDEGLWAVYSVEGGDKDTRRDTMVMDKYYLEGDPTIRWLKISVESGTRMEVPAVTIDDRDNGRVQWTMRVKTRMATERPESLHTDYWGVHDGWGIPPIRINTHRKDNEIARYVAQAQATVIIKSKRGDMQGAVKDAVTGDPIGNAELTLDQCDPNIPDDFHSVWAMSGLDGRYYFSEMYASWNEVRVTAPGYLPRIDRVTIPRDGTLTHDFYLTPESSGGSSGG
jgi:hypothetical protein